MYGVSVISVSSVSQLVSGICVVLFLPNGGKVVGISVIKLNFSVSNGVRHMVTYVALFLSNGKRCLVLV